MIEVRFWPLAEGHDFPKQAVQAAGMERSRRSRLAPQVTVLISQQASRREPQIKRLGN
jgi:hypothetical protein